MAATAAVRSRRNADASINDQSLSDDFAECVPSTMLGEVAYVLSKHALNKMMSCPC